MGRERWADVSSRRGFAPPYRSLLSNLTRLLANVRQQRHKTGTFDCQRDGMLAGGRATAFATADDFALSIGQLIEQIEIFVIDKHRPWPLAFDKNGVFLLRANFGLRALAHRASIFSTTKGTKSRHDFNH